MGTNSYAARVCEYREVIFLVSTFGGVNLRLLVVRCVLNLGCTTILSGVFDRWNFDVGNVVSL